MATFPVPDEVILRHLCPHLAPGDALRFACVCRRHAACLDAAFRRTRATLYHEPVSGGGDATSPAFTAAAVTSWVRAAEDARRAKIAALTKASVAPERQCVVCLYDDHVKVQKATEGVDVASLEIWGLGVTEDAIASALRHIMTAHRPKLAIEIFNYAIHEHALRDEHLAIVTGVNCVYLYNHARITDAGIESLGKDVRFLGVPLCRRVAGDFIPRRIYHDRAPLDTIDWGRPAESTCMKNPFRPRIRAWIDDQVARGLLLS